MNQSQVIAALLTYPNADTGLVNAALSVVNLLYSELGAANNAMTTSPAMPPGEGFTVTDAGVQYTMEIRFKLTPAS
jgi:hypothetical protein